MNKDTIFRWYKTFQEDLEQVNDDEVYDWEGDIRNQIFLR